MNVSGASVAAEEVRQYTSLLREGAGFQKVRDYLVGKLMVDPDDVLMCGALSNEENFTVGALVLPHGKLVSFELDPVGTILEWREVGGVGDLADWFDESAMELAVARSLGASGSEANS